MESVENGEAQGARIKRKLVQGEGQKCTHRHRTRQRQPAGLWELMEDSLDSP